MFRRDTARTVEILDQLVDMMERWEWIVVVVTIKLAETAGQAQCLFSGRRGTAWADRIDREVEEPCSDEIGWCTSTQLLQHGKRGQVKPAEIRTKLMSEHGTPYLCVNWSNPNHLIR